MAAITAFGSARDVDAGELLARAGDATYNLEVILSGSVEVVVIGNDEESVIVEFGPGQFVGELGLITGQRAFLTMRVSRAGRRARDRPRRPPPTARFRTGAGRRRLRGPERPTRPPAVVRSGRCGADHRIAVLTGGARTEGLRHAVRHRPPVDRPRRGRRSRGRARRSRASHTGHARSHHLDGPAAGHAGRARPPPRADLLGASGLPGRPGRGGYRTGRARSRGVRGGRGAAHLRDRRGGGRRPGGRELTDRELRRVPERDLRRRADLARRRAGPTARGTADGAVPGRGASGRGRPPDHHPGRRKRGRHAGRRDRHRCAVPPAPDRRPRAVRGSRRVLRRDGHRGAAVPPAAASSSSVAETPPDRRRCIWPVTRAR